MAGQLVPIMYSRSIENAPSLFSLPTIAPHSKHCQALSKGCTSPCPGSCLWNPRYLIVLRTNRPHWLGAQLACSVIDWLCRAFPLSAAVLVGDRTGLLPVSSHRHLRSSFGKIAQASCVSLREPSELARRKLVFLSRLAHNSQSCSLSTNNI